MTPVLVHRLIPALSLFPKLDRWASKFNRLTMLRYRLKI